MLIGIILAGGSSRRFMQDKALFDDQRFMMKWVEIAVHRQLALADKVYVSANQQNAEALRQLFPEDKVHILLDLAEISGKGPLSGIYTVAKKHPDHRLLITAVDYPFLQADSLLTLCAHPNVYAQDTDGRQHYLIAHLLVDKRMLGHLRQALFSDQLRVQDFIEQMDIHPVVLANSELTTSNYPIS